MEPNLASARSSRTRTKQTYSDAAAAARSIIKAEDDYEDDDDVYRPRPRLQEPEIFIQDLSQLMKMLQAGNIDIDPEYQRDVVWTADRMTGLINSLMEKFYIPPIILNKKPRPNPDASAPQEVYVCVDGKQRLSSVLAFIKGIIPCHDRHGEKWYWSELEGSKRRRILSEQQQREFLRNAFVTFQCKDLSPEQEEDLFARVQMGVQLNLAEKMRASTGPWQELARLFVEDFPTVFALIKDRARSKDFQLALSCFSQIVECMHPTAANGVPILKTNHTHLPKLLSNKGAVDDALKSHLASVWNTFKGLIDADPDTFTNANKYLQGVQTFAPVEMVAVAVLISMHSETRNNRLLLGDIQAMRTAVRESFVDLRMNATVWKWYWEYIDNLEAIRGAIDGSTVSRQTKQRTKKRDVLPMGGVTAGSTVTTITAAAAAPKRGRATARTKRPTEAFVNVTPEETSSAAKKEPFVAPMPDPPPLKRQRTEETVPADLIENGDLMMWCAHHAQSTQSVGMPSIRMDSDQALFPGPAQRPTQQALSTARTPRQRVEPALPGTPSATPAPRQTQVSPLTSTEVQRQQVEQPHNYVTAPTSSSALLSVLPGYRPQQTTEPSQMPVAPMLAGSEVYSSNHSMWQSGGAGQSEMPRTGTWIAVSYPGRSHNASASMPHWTQGQSDKPIDLTSDTEEERVNLLSAFKTRPVSSGASKDTSKLASESVSKKLKSKAEELRTPSRELPTREINPYARYLRS